MRTRKIFIAVLAAGALAVSTTSSSMANLAYVDGYVKHCSWDRTIDTFISADTGLYNDDGGKKKDVWCSYQSESNVFGPPDVDYVVVRAAGNGGSNNNDKTSARLCFRDRLGLSGGLVCGTEEKTFSALAVDLVLYPDTTVSGWTQEDLTIVLITLAVKDGQRGNLKSMQLHTF